MTLIKLLVAILFIDFLFIFVCGLASIWIPALSLFNLKILVFCLTAVPIFIFVYFFKYITFFSPLKIKITNVMLITKKIT
tara:strand:+ start:678 stop:917 length:240 start_codon:yes stop_codon:yes gene_type:complete